MATNDDLDMVDEDNTVENVAGMAGTMTST